MESILVKEHKVTKLFPEMSDEQYQLLRDDIALYGLREPIVVYEGQIVDGRHRYRACVELGIKPEQQDWDGQGLLVEYVLSKNLHRRHLTTSQRAMVAADIRPFLEPEAKGRQGTRTDLGANLRESEKGKSSAYAAKLVNISPRIVEEAVKIKKIGVPKLADMVKSGIVSINAASKLSEMPREIQQNVVSINDSKQLKARLRQLRKKPESIGHEQTLFRSVRALLTKATQLVGDEDPEILASKLVRNAALQNGRLDESVRESLVGAHFLCRLIELTGNCPKIRTSKPALTLNSSRVTSSR